MSKTVVGQSTPTVTANVPATGTAGTAITAGNITSALTGSSGSNASGTITFTVFGPLTNAPTTCTTGGTTVGTATVNNGNATYTSSAGYTPPGAGNYWWYASYGGDANNGAANSGCGTAGMSDSETVVARATPTLTASGPTNGTIGTAITAGNITSTLAASSGSNASGTITFKVFAQATAPTTCTTGGTTVGTATVNNGNATYTSSAGYTPTGAGNYWWYASYGGDTNNNAATSTCGGTMSETTVAKFSPTVTVGAPGSGTAGTAIAAGNINSVLAAGTTAPVMTGTITFTVFGPQASAPTTCTTGGTTVGTGTAVNGNATYNPTAGYTPTGAGNYWWYASYGSDANNNAATSTCGSLMSKTVVGLASPTVTASGPATGAAGTAITVGNISSTLAASSGSNATGTITFKVFAQTTAPTTCTTGGTTVGTGTTVERQRHLQPDGRLHADDRRQPVVVRVLQR